MSYSSLTNVIHGSNITQSENKMTLKMSADNLSRITNYPDSDTKSKRGSGVFFSSIELNTVAI